MRTRLLLGSAALVILVVTAVVVVLVGRTGPDRDAARAVADDYLAVLSDPDRDPTDLDDLIAVGDDLDLATADAALGAATERITDVSVGDPVETDTARASTDAVFDTFLRFPVTYVLHGAAREATLTLGLRRGGGWLVVEPLTGSVDWPSAAADGVLLDVEVGGVPVTPPDRTSYVAAPVLLHPAVYRAQARVGASYTSGVVDVTVAAGTDPVRPPRFDLALTRAGSTTLRASALAAFEACRRGTAYCPVAPLVYPSGSTTLAPGWYRGLTSQPEVVVDGDRVRLEGGAFRYRSPQGVRTVTFRATSTIRIDPDTREPEVATPLDVTRLRAAEGRAA